ncbi:MAG: hypothetical protein A2Y82_03815 [Candidatus Buchananbacteria bacterium RBG_13_36_9]|uniref:Uncharacterized protein n=1 Tax=Candidatus Buchananbacteria bacterium RBG_13_36_9 TaxID=1797530 RepID=A0A1G1XNZ3_9BACT|nr:MAG: hypothetical protein A2Y82_03815 [Candidatus Buchananbacteria bacterium RBG_13_36_9]
MEKATLAQGQELLKLVSQSSIEKDGLQALLESGEFTTLLRKYSYNIITRFVRVDRTRTPRNAINAIKGDDFVNDSLLKHMPACGEGVEKNVEVIFFRLCRATSDNELALEYEKRGLKPDPYAVAAVNEADPKFASDYPNATHWKDVEGKWVIFYIQSVFGKPCASCSCSDLVDHNIWWWFGGVRK